MSTLLNSGGKVTWPPTDKILKIKQWMFKNNLEKERENDLSTFEGPTYPVSAVWYLEGKKGPKNEPIYIEDSESIKKFLNDI